MINFIVCDDNKEITILIKDVISKYMMKNKIQFKTYIYYDYDDKFMNILNSKLQFKIYILDIEMPTRSGIDIARIIRNTDINSIIIFLTGHEELGMTILKDEIMCLSFINKFDDCEKRLTVVLKKALKLLNRKTMLKFEEKSIIYTIPLDDILYITRDTIERKCIIKTEYSEFKTYKTLQELKTMLDGRFIQTHRACLINKDRITIKNYRKKIITFDTGETTNLISDKYKKQIMSE